MLNNLALWIYLIELTSRVQTFFIILMVGFFLLGLGVLVYSADKSQWIKDEEKKDAFDKIAVKRLKFIAKSLIFCLFMAFIFPSQATMYTMLGINTLKELVSHPKVDDLTSKSLLLLENKINQLLEIKESN